jgi:hypothetical protein
LHQNFFEKRGAPFSESGYKKGKTPVKQKQTR